ncbi:MAG: hypothetical protein M0R70_00250 [Nitrospirae bacterium]|nr:hypothetical protein [Nitrospirota bacterium]
MKRIVSSLPFVAASAVFSFFISLAPAGVDAAEHQVGSAREFKTIQEAISSPTFSAGDSIVVDRGIYAGPITLPHNVTIKGAETAKTFLTGNGGGPVVIVDETQNVGAIGAGTVNIRNFTFVNASTGISVLNNTANSTTVNIMNNVFAVGPGGTAITEQSSIHTKVANNTFFQNGTALSCDWDLDISNNIFSLNTTAIAYATAYITNNANKNNAFFGNSVSGPTGMNPIAGDPLFVDPVNHDFHLKQGSPCIGTGNNSGSPNDIGVYGGSSADTIPFKISDLRVESTTDTSIDLSWSPNNCYLVTNTTSTLVGGYQLYFGSAPGTYTGILTSSGTITSPIQVGASTSYTLSGLIPPSTPLSAPVLDAPSPRDSKLILTWSAVSGATGYRVHYGISSLDEHDPIDVENTTSYELSGLTNNQTYLVAVSAYARQKYFFAVTAYDNQFSSSATTSLRESIYSEETSTQIGATRYSDLSNVPPDVYPEEVIAYPALPDSGGRCFIATAAYGYYSAPEVQALRAFRDRYLLTSAPGRMFVHWYYRHGPAAATFLNDHPGYKPLVRMALMPAVGASILMTGTSMRFKAIMFLVLGAAIAFGFFRKRLSRTGGLR